MKLLKYSTIYNNLTKVADIKSNMALRILHSLIPSFISNPEEARLLSLERSKDLIPGAKELLKYGRKIIQSELKYAAFDLNIKSDNYIEFFEKAKKAFMSNIWESSSFGGASWARIADLLLNIAKIVDNYESSKDINDLSELSYYLNALDGLMHNSGSVLEKMLLSERGFSGYAPVNDNSNIGEHIASVKKLMNAKELKNPANVLKVIDPVLRNSAPHIKSMYGDDLSKFRSQNLPSHLEKIEYELSEIERKKVVISYLELTLNHSINYLKNYINSGFGSPRDIRHASDEIALFPKQFQMWLNTKQIEINFTDYEISNLTDAASKTQEFADRHELGKLPNQIEKLLEISTFDDYMAARYKSKDVYLSDINNAYKWTSYGHITVPTDQLLKPYAITTRQEIESKVKRVIEAKNILIKKLINAGQIMYETVRSAI